MVLPGFWPAGRLSWRGIGSVVTRAVRTARKSYDVNYEEIQTGAAAADLPLLARIIFHHQVLFDRGFSDQDIAGDNFHIGCRPPVPRPCRPWCLDQDEIPSCHWSSGASEELGLSVREAAKADTDKMRKDEWCRYFQPHCQCRSLREGRIRFVMLPRPQRRWSRKCRPSPWFPAMRHTLRRLAQELSGSGCLCCMAAATQALAGCAQKSFKMSGIL